MEDPDHALQYTFPYVHYFLVKPDFMMGKVVKILEQKTHQFPLHDKEEYFCVLSPDQCSLHVFSNTFFDFLTVQMLFNNTGILNNNILSNKDHIYW